MGLQRRPLPPPPPTLKHVHWTIGSCPCLTCPTLRRLHRLLTLAARVTTSLLPLQSLSQQATAPHQSRPPTSTAIPTTKMLVLRKRQATCLIADDLMHARARFCHPCSTSTSCSSRSNTGWLNRAPPCTSHHHQQHQPLSHLLRQPVHLAPSLQLLHHTHLHSLHPHRSTQLRQVLAHPFPTPQPTGHPSPLSLSPPASRGVVEPCLPLLRCRPAKRVQVAGGDDVAAMLHRSTVKAQTALRAPTPLLLPLLLLPVLLLVVVVVLLVREQQEGRRQGPTVERSPQRVVPLDPVAASRRWCKEESQLSMSCSFQWRS
eukprot:m.94135 g.94135  ORF g.94135 m.94135 type:complete len:316 (-) comp13842_c4_seq1:506-1453(-)